jgi:RNA polymerase sigma factor (sigma-70 family)
VSGLVNRQEGTALDVVERAQAGDQEAFEMLVERHATEIYRLSAAIIGEADARDLTQETFVTACSQLGHLRRADAFAPWLRRICVNRCRNWLRARTRRGRTTSLDADALLAGTLPAGVVDFRDAADARAVLEPAFAALSPDHRALLALHYSMGFSISESADAIGIPAGTAKSRLNAALAVLRAAIEPSKDPVHPSAREPTP